MNKSINVNNRQELLSALDEARGGETILLAPGDYGTLSLGGDLHSEEVTVTSQDPEDPARFHNINLWNVTNMTFDSVLVDFRADASTPGHEAAFRAAGNSAHISLVNSRIQGHGASDPDAPYGSVGRAVTIFGAHDATIANNEISHFGRGIVPGEDDYNLKIVGNVIHDLKSSPISGGAGDNVLIEGNHFHSSHPGAGVHADLIHLFTSKHAAAPAQGITIRGNFFEQGDGKAILGIYLDDDDNNVGFRDVVIEDNVIHNGHAQGIRLENAPGTIVRHNTLLEVSGGADKVAPRIVLRGDSSGTLIEKNIVRDIWGGEESTVTIRDNLVPQDESPFEPNYVGSIFVNGLVNDGDAGDFRTVVGGDADGYGSRIHRVDTSPREIDGYIFESRGDGFEMAQHSFSAENVFGPEGRIDLSDAVVEWAFGDGHSATGAAISHGYDAGGVYDVVARITTDGGEVLTLEKTLRVFHPVAVTAGFEDGARDDSGVPLDVRTLGDVSFEDSDFGAALRLEASRSALGFERAPKLLDNTEFSISAMFKKDAGAEGSGGRIVYFSSTAILGVQGDGLSLRGSTDLGEEFRLLGKTSAVTDDAWHQVTYTFSQEEGAATLYLDGQELDRIEGLSGKQTTTGGHDLFVGNPFGYNFRGLIDEVEFLRAALTPAQVAERFAEMMDGEAPVPADPGPSEEPEAEEPEAPVEPEEPQPPEEPEAPNEEPGTPDDPMPGEANTRSYVLDIPALAAEDASTLRGDAHVVFNAGGAAVQFDGRKDFVNLGHLKEFEASDQLAFTVEFSRAAPEGDAARLVWNHLKMGLTLQGDGFVFKAATADKGLEDFAVGGLGLDDTETHRATVLIDAEADQLQIIVDDAVVLNETDTDFDFVGAGGREWGWWVGTPWNKWFHGEVTDFQMYDRVDFIDLEGVLPTDEFSIA